MSAESVLDALEAVIERQSKGLRFSEDTRLLRDYAADLIVVARAAQKHANSPGALAADLKHKDLREALALLTRDSDACECEPEKWLREGKA